MIVHKSDGWHVLSEKNRKNLGGPYATRAEAEKRLRQVEYFKHAKPGSPGKAKAAARAHTPSAARH